MTKQEIDKHLQRLELKYFAEKKRELENFSDKELRDKHSNEAHKIFDEIEQCLEYHNLSWVYYNSLSFCKKVWPELKKIYNELHQLEKEEEEAKCTGPRPKDFSVLDDFFEISGNIIITDPCYINEFILTTYNRDTLYGDWGCCVWNMNPETKEVIDRKNPIGQFCADGGMVCVTNISKDGLETENKIRDWVDRHKHCGTIIDNFSGKIEYIIEHSFFASHGEWKEDISLIINGIGTKDSKPFAFTTYQTSL